MPASVLIVDDDPAILKSVGVYLERLQYDVGLASLGYEGLDLHFEHGYDVVILDLCYPICTV